MATSTIPAFKSALVARLQADTDLAGVQVTYGLPAPKGPDREWVWVGNAQATQETAAMGQRRREEEWTQEVVVSCLTPVRESQETLTERAFEIAGVVEDSLRAWLAPSEGPFGGVVRHALVVGMDLVEVVSTDPQGVAKDREARVTVRISCANRI